MPLGRSSPGSLWSGPGRSARAVLACITRQNGARLHSAGSILRQAGRAAQVLAMLEHQILAAVLQIVPGPGGVASFLRRNLLGQGLNGPSLPLDVGQP